MCVSSMWKVKAGPGDGAVSVVHVCFLLKLV